MQLALSYKTAVAITDLAWIARTSSVVVKTSSNHVHQSVHQIKFAGRVHRYTLFYSLGRFFSTNQRVVFCIASHRLTRQPIES